MKLFLSTFFIFAVLLVGILFYILHLIPSREFPLFDFKTFYLSGVMFTHGVKSTMYDVSVQNMWQKQLFDTARIGFELYYNPPFVALLFAPLTLFSFTNAYRIFACINIALLLISLFLIFYAFLSEFKREEVPLVFLCTFSLFFFPIVFALWMGQLSYMLFISLVGSWYMLKRKKLFFAGLMLSLLCIKPYFLLLPFALLFWKKQWQVIGGILCGGIIWTSISWLIVGWDGFIAYGSLLVHALSASAHFGMLPQREPTLLSLLRLIFHTDGFSLPLTVLFIIGEVVCVSLCFFAWRGKLHFEQQSFDSKWAVLLVMLLLTGIHSNYYDVLLLLFPILILLRQFSSIMRVVVGGIIDSILILFYVESSLLVPFIFGLAVLLIWFLSYETKKTATNN